jgi:hydroxyacylglutathione hydrolase
MLEIVPFVLGPVSTNCYLLADPESGEAVVIDPGWNGRVIMAEAQKRGWKIGQLWYTHAHFDHFGGASEIAEGINHLAIVALHPLDHDLWKMQGGAPLFGMRIDPGPEPTVDLAHGQILRMGSMTFEVRHTPGHTPGHCVFYCEQAQVLFSGDLIFQGGVGRTDLPGGDWEMLVESIRGQVYSLPDETRVLSGHGQGTRVGEEVRKNPYVRASGD